MKGFASQNICNGLDDSPRASDLLSCRLLVETFADVLENFEPPYISVTCRTFREKDIARCRFSYVSRRCAS